MTAVQRVTNLEKKTDEMKTRMDDFQLLVQKRWDAWTSAVELPPTDKKNVPSLENEDEEFTEGFNGVIKSEDLVDEPVKFCLDSLLNMEVGVNLEEQGF